MDVLPADDPWASYGRTVVVIVRPGEANLVVEAAPPGETAVWPWPSHDAVHVLTAWDPGEARRGEAENRASQVALEADLELLAPRETWSTVGVDPVSGHREEGVAVCGLGSAVVIDLGARYGQDAIFEWTPAEWTIVACRGERRAAFGWSVSPG